MISPGQSTALAPQHFIAGRITFRDWQQQRDAVFALASAHSTANKAQPRLAGQRARFFSLRHGVAAIDANRLAERLAHDGLYRGADH